jgi:hypothetical protein
MALYAARLLGESAAMSTRGMNSIYKLSMSSSSEKRSAYF